MSFKQVWLKPGFIIYNSPYDQTEKTHTLSPYQKIEGDILVFAEGREFLRLKLRWLDFRWKIFLKRITVLKKYRNYYLQNYQNDQFSIYVKQLSTGKEAGINENQRMYAASIMKLPYLYYAQEKINQGDIQLDTSP